MILEEMKRKLEKALTPKRFVHSVNVMNTSVELAERYSGDKEKAAVAGLLHDCARDIRGDEAVKLCDRFNIKPDEIMQRQPELLHGPLGSKLAREEYGVTDEEILKAIHWHTTGCKNMCMLEKIVFIADYVEPGRSFPGVEEVRKVVRSDIDRAIIMALDSTIKHILSKGTVIHPDTIDARNYMILHPCGKPVALR